MRRLGSNVLVALLSAPLLTACPGNGGEVGDGGSGSETGTGGSSTTDGMTSTPTTQSTTNMSMSGTSASTTTPDPDSTTTDDPTTGNDTTTTDDPTTTGAGDECGECIETNCDGAIGDCLDTPDCVCWIECFDNGNDPEACFAKCGPPPEELDELGNCIDAECDMECNGGGMETEGGMGVYDQCGGPGDCPMGQDCNDFVGYCSIQCMGDGNNCPAPATGDVDPVCSNFSDNCILPCGPGDTCPDGMSCQDVGGPMDLCAF